MVSHHTADEDGSESCNKPSKRFFFLFRYSSGKHKKWKEKKKISNNENYCQFNDTLNSQLSTRFPCNDFAVNSYGQQ